MPSVIIATDKKYAQLMGLLDEGGICLEKE